MKFPDSAIVAILWMFAIEWTSLNAPTHQRTSNRNLLGSSQAREHPTEP
ncbi:hypothetical protein QUA70_21550 [Microcoleus sp. LAD1_D5]